MHAPSRRAHEANEETDRSSDDRMMPADGICAAANRDFGTSPGSSRTNLRVRESIIQRWRKRRKGKARTLQRTRCRPTSQSRRSIEDEIKPRATSLQRARKWRPCHQGFLIHCSGAIAFALFSANPAAHRTYPSAAHTGQRQPRTARNRPWRRLGDTSPDREMTRYRLSCDRARSYPDRLIVASKPCVARHPRERATTVMPFGPELVPATDLRRRTKGMVRPAA